MRGRLVAMVLTLVLALASCLGRPDPTWASVDADIARRFPEVQRVARPTLLARLRDGHPPILLDVREPAEYAVSHLPGARRVDPGVSEVSGIAPDDDIVVYCSVGERSSALAHRLLARGFHHVADLDGGIFRWAGDGLPLERDGRPTKGVHPYDERWGSLLARERWEWPGRTTDGGASEGSAAQRKAPP